MRKISIGDKVIFEKYEAGLIEGIVVDIKWIPGPWREYAVRSVYSAKGYGERLDETEHLDWFYKYDLARKL